VREETMQAVHFLGNGDISLHEVPMPAAEGRDVIVRIRSAAICGTDRENLEGAGQSTVPGHESAGDVVAVDQASWLGVGDRVAINCHITCGSCEHCVRGDVTFCEDLRIVGFDIDGGFAEYARVPQSCCMPLPDDVSYESGALLVDMLGTAYRAVKRAGISPGDRVAVWGAGPVGLSALIVASWLNADVGVVDLNPYRLEMARSLGAKVALNGSEDAVETALRDWTEGRGVDVAFECAGNAEAAEQALRTVRKRGTFAYVGVADQLVLDPWEDLIRRELTIYGSRCFVLPEFDDMISLVRRGLPVGEIVTHRFPLREAESAFSVFCSGQCGKVLLEP
jgi:propanol-preferring alcohol dehydrogenase